MLNRFQALKKAVDAKFDLPDTVLSSMARACFDGKGSSGSPIAVVFERKLRKKLWRLWKASTKLSMKDLGRTADNMSL
jgi:hypothetical protein